MLIGEIYVFYEKSIYDITIDFFFESTVHLVRNNGYKNTL